MILRLLTAAALVAIAAPAVAQTYTFACQPDRRTVDGKEAMIPLGDQFLHVDRRVFSFDEKAGKACEVDVARKACLPGAFWRGAADQMFTQISFTRDRPDGASIDVLTLRTESGLFSARILSPDKGEIRYAGKCEALTNLAVKLPE